MKSKDGADYKQNYDLITDIILVSGDVKIGDAEIKTEIQDAVENNLSSDFQM